MCLPDSALVSVQDISGAGRGIIAKKDLPPGTLLLSTDGPAAHTIFRQYRKEVCARCFAYYRGRTLPVRDASTGKVYCAAECRILWANGQGPHGVKAWQAIHTFVQANVKASVGLDVEMGTTPRPNIGEIAAAWQRAEQQASPTPQKRSKVSPHRHVDADILGYFLAGVLRHIEAPDEWHEVSQLAMDPEPYKSTEDLQAYCRSYVQLKSLLHQEVQLSCTAAFCRTLVSAGSHNAFGIRAGGEDAEEYMGYGVWPVASYFNHSCSPNVLKERIGSQWTFRAANKIAAGEECCITYLGGDEKGLNVSERRARLSEVWGFQCQCRRCVHEGGSIEDA